MALLVQTPQADFWSDRRLSRIIEILTGLLDTIGANCENFVADMRLRTHRKNPNRQTKRLKRRKPDYSMSKST